MGIEFKLSDQELPASATFIAFLDRIISHDPSIPEAWPDQTAEQLVATDGAQLRRAVGRASEVMAQPLGRERVVRAYELLVALLIGNTEALRPLQARFRFVCVIGIPRSGGSYLTAELYRSLHMEPRAVPGPIAHDSFPEAGPFDLAAGMNAWVQSLKTLAEYLSMVELFYADQPCIAGKVVVPKKLTQAAYCGGLFGRVLGSDAEFTVTLRHPAAACLSTYEKSGGLPRDGRFAVRSNIEAWCRRDLIDAGYELAELESMDYFDAYLRYWERYHLLLATSGLTGVTRPQIVTYGRSSMQAAAGRHHGLHRSGLHASQFEVAGRAAQTHPEWVDRARPVIDRVTAVWQSVGLTFPARELDDCA